MHPERAVKITPLKAPLISVHNAASRGKMRREKARSDRCYVSCSTDTDLRRTGTAGWQEQGAIPEPTKQHPAQHSVPPTPALAFGKTCSSSGLMFTITTALMILDESVMTFKCALKLLQLPLNQVMKSHR